MTTNVVVDSSGRQVAERHAAMRRQLLHDLRSVLAIATGMVDTVRRHGDELEPQRVSSLLDRTTRAHRALHDLVAQVGDLGELVEARALPTPVAATVLLGLVVETMDDRDVEVTSAPDVAVLVDVELAVRGLVHLCQELLGRGDGRTAVRLRARTMRSTVQVDVTADGLGERAAPGIRPVLAAALVEAGGGAVTRPATGRWSVTLPRASD